MSSDGSFLFEEFINSITSQLDRVQDALRLKAVNRPLTYALKDLALELQVFVELDAQGNVRFRTSGPNETGASKVQLGFTTITKPMIEENTVSLAMSRSPLLNELGLDAEQQKRLEQLGVRNAAQLQRLGNSTGASAVSRLTDIPIERLHQALRAGRPQVNVIRPGGNPAQTPPLTQPPRPAPRPAQEAPPQRPVKQMPSPFKAPPPATHLPVGVPQRPPTPPAISPPVHQPPLQRPMVAVAPGTSHLHLFGQNLIGEGGVPEVRLNNRILGVSEAEDDRLVVEMPKDIEGGALEVTLPDGQTLTYNLSVTPDEDAGEHTFEAHGYDGEGNGRAQGQDDQLYANQRDWWEPEGGDS
ncbi:MAG: hypothetical protein ACJ754_00425 [Pyrinomonadaceae bacterium]